MAVRTCSAQRRRVRRRHPRRTRVETYARAKIQQQHFGSPPSTAIRSRPMGHERQTRHDSRQRPKPITTHRRPRHALRQGERILAPVVSAVIWVVEESFGGSAPKWDARFNPPPPWCLMEQGVPGSSYDAGSHRSFCPPLNLAVRTPSYHPVGSRIHVTLGCGWH
jgi:hypothetical protein